MLDRRLRRQVRKNKKMNSLKISKIIGTDELAEEIKELANLPKKETLELANLPKSEEKEFIKEVITNKIRNKKKISI